MCSRKGKFLDRKLLSFFNGAMGAIRIFCWKERGKHSENRLSSLCNSEFPLRRPLRKGTIWVRRIVMTGQKRKQTLGEELKVIMPSGCPYDNTLANDDSSNSHIKVIWSLSHESELGSCALPRAHQSDRSRGRCRRPVGSRRSDRPRRGWPSSEDSAQIISLNPHSPSSQPHNVQFRNVYLFMSRTVILPKDHIHPNGLLCSSAITHTERAANYSDQKNDRKVVKRENMHARKVGTQKASALVLNENIYIH